MKTIRVIRRHALKKRVFHLHFLIMFHYFFSCFLLTNYTGLIYSRLDLYVYEHQCQSHCLAFIAISSKSLLNISSVNYLNRPVLFALTNTSVTFEQNKLSYLFQSYISQRDSLWFFFGCAKVALSVILKEHFESLRE